MRSPMLLALAILAQGLFAGPLDWPHPRGPEFDGQAPFNSSFPESLKLVPLWKSAIGPGYSACTLKGENLATAYAHGESDWLVVMSTIDGQERWRFRLSDRYLGHDGSTDGPLSTPVVGGGLVFAISAWGRLVAVNLNSGILKWEIDLAQRFGAPKPTYGFTTTPLYVEISDQSLLVVQAGGTEGRHLVALDASNGNLKWHYGEGKADYRSPVLAQIHGQKQILVANPRSLMGISPSDGSLQWRHELAEDNPSSSGMPMPLGANRVILRTRGGVTSIGVTHGEQGFATELQYVSPTLGQNYAAPVVYGDYLYGFRGNILTCMDGRNGNRVWRSREPGGEGLLRVDNLLLVFAAKGQVVAVKADPQGYQELARTTALSASSLIWPSFSNGTLFVRNMDQVAAVRLEGGDSDSSFRHERGDHLMARLARELDLLAPAERQQKVDAFFQKHSNLPLVDGDWVHFVYRGDAQNVGITGTMFYEFESRDMRRFEQTDTFYLSVKIPQACRVEYRYQLDFERWIADPMNPHQVPPLDGDDAISELVTPGYIGSDHWREDGSDFGRLEQFKLTSSILGGEREITVWVPAEYADGEQRFPLLVVNDGEPWLNKAFLTRSLGQLANKTIQPVVVAFVPAAEIWWVESGAERARDYARMLSDELVPAMESRYRLRNERSARAILGTKQYAITALYTALAHGDVFGAAAVQSASLALIIRQDVLAAINQGMGKDARLYLDWNLFDERNPDRSYDSATDSANLFAALKENGYRVEGGEVRDSIGWSGWRNRSHVWLELMFPLNADGIDQP